MSSIELILSSTCDFHSPRPHRRLRSSSSPHTEQPHHVSNFYRLEETIDPMGFCITCTTVASS